MGNRWQLSIQAGIVLSAVAENGPWRLPGTHADVTLHTFEMRPEVGSSVWLAMQSKRLSDAMR